MSVRMQSWRWLAGAAISTGLGLMAWEIAWAEEPPLGGVLPIWPSPSPKAELPEVLPEPRPKNAEPTESTPPPAIMPVEATRPGGLPADLSRSPSPGSLVPFIAKVATVEAGLNGEAAFAQMLADARTSFAKHRDYVCHMVRQERVGDVLLPEQTCELRVRSNPFSIAVSVIAPKPIAGWEVVYVAGKFDEKVRFRPAGVPGAGHTLVALDNPKVLVETSHTATDTGLQAVLKRVEKLVETEKKANNPVQIVAADYTFQDKPVRRFDIFTERPHARRYAYRSILYVDKATSLPVRFEAYDQPKTGATTGELIEMVSFVNVKFDTGLADATFHR